MQREDYGEYLCTARNELGAGEGVVVLEPSGSKFNRFAVICYHIFLYNKSTAINNKSKQVEFELKCLTCDAHVVGSTLSTYHCTVETLQKLTFKNVLHLLVDTPNHKIDGKMKVC